MKIAKKDLQQRIAVESIRHADKIDWLYGISKEFVKAQSNIIDAQNIEIFNQTIKHFNKLEAFLFTKMFKDKKAFKITKWLLKKYFSLIVAYQLYDERVPAGYRIKSVKIRGKEYPIELTMDFKDAYSKFHESLK